MLIQKQWKWTWAETILTASIVVSSIPARTTVASADDRTAYAVTTKKSNDQIETKTNAESVIFDIKSPSGIGGAKITTTKGKWPTTIVLRLHLAGLESFNASNGKLKLIGSVLSHSGNTKQLHLSEVGTGKEREAGTEIKVLDAKGKPAKGLPGKDGYFEITLPKAMLESQPKSLEIGWVDFYRT